MHILSLGLNHQTAPIALRERLAFSEEASRAALARSLSDNTGSLAEMIILSTCNRIEVYAASPFQDFCPLKLLVEELRGVPPDEYAPYTYTFTDAEAVQHLFKVAAGLDSLVLGEPQILGQVNDALLLARSQNTVGPILNRLFQAAIHAGKRARSETSINRHPASVSSLAVSLCEHIINPIYTAQVVVLGAGEMAKLAINTLRKRGVNKILVLNRTLQNAMYISERWDVDSAPIGSLDQALARADILIAATGATSAIVSAEMVAKGMAERDGRPLVLVDITFPRNIDPATAAIPGVTLYDIDHLNAQLEYSLAMRQREVPRVRAILAEEIAEFMDFYQSLDMLPLISDLRQQAEAIRLKELEKTLHRLPGLSESERSRIEALTEALVKKLLACPTQRLRAEAACQHALQYASVARTLFGLDDSDSSCAFSEDSCPIASPAD